MHVFFFYYKKNKNFLYSVVKVIVINNIEMPFIQKISQSGLCKVSYRGNVRKQVAVRHILGHHLSIRGPDLSFSNNAETFLCMQTAFETEDGGCRMVIAEVMGGKRP